MTVLIVDDEITQLETLRRGLRKRGFVVAEALRAGRALEMIGTPDSGIDLVLTDFAMPDMNGIGFLQEIRRAGHHLPVIMMSAYGEKKLILDALRNQCDGFIEKPFTLDQLMAEIERVRGRLPKESQMDGFSRIVPRWVHQINNPLASIMGSAELGLGEIGDSRAVARRMACILSATETIRQMCRDIMQLGQRYEEGFSRVEVTELLDSSLEVFADLMTGKGASLIREYPDERLVVNCRPKGLGEVLQNLILNALEAMEASPAKVLRVAVERAGAGGPCAIVIEDSGPGIPAERTSRVFSPYFTTKPGGNGLGLAVARDLMERMGGRIELQSEVGRGTLLRLWLPAVLEPGESSGEERPLASAC